ncbi:hypothetical protein [Pseudomonas sp. MWU12-2037]|uniref:hypothetical protein n=1 Tax=Pseudomonas sp. MWU12-2037 TaxID=2928690 RepID=UPI00200E39B5|nr:hypothetical protein [Pseudomonas sp. MWU12-2037]
MTLLNKISNNLVAQRVDITYLKSVAKDDYYSKKQKLLNQKIIEAEGQIKDILVVIPPHTNITTLGALPTTAGVNFLMHVGVGTPPAPASKVQKLMAVIVLFEVIQPQAATVISFEAPKADATYPYLSERFSQRHVAKTTEVAQQRATQRYNADNTVVVSSFLLPTDARTFNDEVRDLNTAGFFKALNKWLAKTRKERTLANALITDIVIRSKTQMGKWQCTQATQFVPFSAPDYVYYCVADYPNSKGYQKSIADHYVRRAELLSGDNLIAGYTEFDIEESKQYSFLSAKQWEKLLEAMTVGNAPLDGVRIYINKGLIVA